MSKVSQIKNYMVTNPKASAAEVAKKCKTTIGYVYIVRSQMKKAAPKVKKADGVDIDAAHKTVTLKAVQPAPAPLTLPITLLDKPHDPVSHPAHYTDGGIETIDFIESKRLGYHLGNVVKYISRAGKKGTSNGLEDLRKAQWYLARAIEKNETTANR